MEKPDTAIEARPVIASPDRTRRTQGRSLHVEAAELVTAMHEAQILGDQLLERFARIDAARKVLEPLGLVTAVEFIPEIEAALMKWRANGRDVFDIPDWLRVPAEQR